VNRTTIGIITGIVVLVVAVPVLVALFLFPLRSETEAGKVNDNLVPSDLQALTVHDRLAIQLTWTAVDQRTATYLLQRSEDGGADSWEDLTELAPDTTSYLDDDDLQDGVTYLYRIYAWDSQGGSGYSNGASAMATALPQPNMPSGLSQDELDTLQAELNANIVKWQQAGLSDYTFEFSVSCSCLTSITAPVRVTVRDTNTIESISYVETGEPVTEYLDLYLTVGGMFDMIQEAIDMRVANLTVSYDPETGYPTNVFVDRDFMMADEERGFEVRNLDPIEPPTLEESQSRLNSSRELWESSGLSSYEIEYRRICFCPPDITSPVLLVVRNGIIDSRTYAETGEPVGEAVRDLFPEVSGMFDIVQDAIDQQASQVTVTYDSQLGYPVNIRIDYNTMMADEELEFAISSLK
jgi:hypothetical protein